MPPVAVTLEIRGWRSFPDVIDFGATQLLVTEHFITQFNTAQMSGLIFSRGVDVLEWSGLKIQDTPPQYLLADIEMDPIRVDDSASGALRESDGCSACGAGALVCMRKLVFTQDTWGGRDIFWTAMLPGRVLCSEHFKRQSELFRWPFQFQPSEEYQVVKS